MRFEYTPCKMTEVEEFQQEHVQSLSAPVDTFLDAFVLASQFYAICVEDDPAGFFAIHDPKVLTQFYLKKAYIQLAPDLFQDLVQKNSVSAALVPSCDELLYNVTLDQFSKIEKLGYFFEDNNQNPCVMDVNELGCFQEATTEDIPKIGAISAKFFDDLERRIQRQEIFVLYATGVLLGIGIIEKSLFLPGYVSVGTFVNSRQRHKGIGTAIIAQLKKWCYERNFKPIAGCAYENIGSKRTLEKAGFVCKTQLFKVHF